jgi:two-component system response regulator MprA
MTAPVVLVVEDNLEIRETIAVILRSMGLGVMAAADGAQALAQLRASASPPSLILLDLMMPVMDGYAFREAQRSDPDLEKIPVVVVTADGEAAKKAASLQTAGHLKKPIDLDALLEEVARHVGSLGGS